MAREPRIVFEVPAPATSVCAATGIGLLLLSVTQSGVLCTVLATYAGLLLNFALLDYVLAPDGASVLAAARFRRIAAIVHDLGSEVFESLRQAVRWRADLVWLAAITGVGVWVRAYSLRQPMSYDEAYTFLYLVQKGFPGLFFYPVPNNHVLHTILVRWSTLLLGSSPETIRVPAFLAGTATIPLTFLLCRTLLPSKSGYFAASAMSIYAYLVLYSTMARGYSLLTLLSLVLALVGLHVIRRPSWPGCAVLSLIGALGMFTIPTMLFALAGLYLWLGALLAIARRSVWTAVRDLLIPCGALTALLTGLIYTPVIIESDGVHSIVANPFVEPQPWSKFTAEIASHVGAVLHQFSWDVPARAVAAGALLVAIGVLGAVRARNWAVLLLLPSMLLGGVVILLAQHRIPFSRTWIYLIPFAFVAADAGWTYVTAALPRLLRFACAVILLAAASSHAMTMMKENLVPQSMDFHDAAGIVRELKTVMQPGDLVHVKLPSDVPTYFYMWYYGLPVAGTAPHAGAREYFVVETRLNSIADLTQQPVVLIARVGGGALYRLDAPALP